MFPFQFRLESRVPVSEETSVTYAFLKRQVSRFLPAVMEHTAEDPVARHHFSPPHHGQRTLVETVADA